MKRKSFSHRQYYPDIIIIIIINLILYSYGKLTVSLYLSFTNSDFSPFRWNLFYILYHTWFGPGVRVYVCLYNNLLITCPITEIIVSFVLMNAQGRHHLVYVCVCVQCYYANIVFFFILVLC